MSTVVSDCFTIGSVVSTRTCYNENIEGEVLAFDPQTKMLILKCPSSSGNPKRHDVNIVNLSLVSDVQIKKEVSAMPEPPASLNLHRLNTRVRNSIETKRRLWSGFNLTLESDSTLVENVLGDKESKPYNYIRKFVERHWRDHREHGTQSNSQTLFVHK
ncbi:hypothetical protein K1T71_015023 [Dendrolimus kikuchii]|nr:hypothetical protein K1T71_015023 [Dendrolimus kikuchii]